MARKSRLSLSNQQQEHEDPGVSRKDLDVAIDASDWATVGATAALLATTQTPVSQQTRGAGAGSTNSNRTGMSDLDQQRANELDHLVDTGDWEGVVLAAAKFESSPGFRSDDSSSMDPSAAGFTVNASLASETPSNIKKRSEILAEVEDLVRKVVPDEAENIDEMMRQFYGREEELLETLRSMQERAIAQRQRLAVQKSAKREAVQLKSVPQAPSAPEAGDTVASGSNAETSTVFSDPQFEGIQAEDVGSGSGSGSKTTTDGSGFGGVPPAVALRKTKEDDEKERLEKEEQDALAQAAIWKKIAAANKPEEGTDSEREFIVGSCSSFCRFQHYFAFPHLFSYDFAIFSIVCFVFHHLRNKGCKSSSGLGYRTQSFGSEKCRKGYKKSWKWFALGFNG